MQTPTQVLNIGADVAKDEIVVAGSEGSFPVRKLANQRTALLAFLKSLPLGSRIGTDAFVAFTGLDPRPDDSGQHRGKRRLSKRGPSELRRLLFLAALSAAKTKAWHPLYERYREKGLSSTAVLVILARRIARTAWSMYTYKTEFDPARLTKGLT